MPWWSNLPSLTPLKGLGKFLYIWTHWEEISADLKKRDDRLQAVEELAEQMVRLKEKAHAEEMRVLERTLKEERDKWNALAGRSAEHMEAAVARMEEMQRANADLREVLSSVVRWLAIILVVESDQQMRDLVRASLQPELGDLLDVALGMMEEKRQKLLDATLFPPPPLPSQGGMDVRSSQTNAPAEGTGAYTYSGSDEAVPRPTEADGTRD